MSNIGGKRVDIGQIINDAKQIRSSLLRNAVLARHIDRGRDNIPTPWIGSGEIKLILIGQDPTVKNEKSRDAIKTVLNLDKQTSLYRYLSFVAERIGCSVEENVYATNLLKCFFVAPPASIPSAVKEHAPYWIDLLKKELAQYPNAQVITLGEPLLRALVTSDSKKVRDYWGYRGNNLANIDHFKYCDESANLLQRSFFPFPHQPSIRKAFYRSYIDKYIDFMRKS